MSTDEHDGAPKMGRPPLPKGEAKGSTFSLRLKPGERSIIDAAAKRAGFESASEWARRALMAMAADLLADES